MKFKESMTYDVIENDIALLNVYFGENTAVGRCMKANECLFPLKSRIRTKLEEDHH